MTSSVYGYLPAAVLAQAKDTQDATWDQLVRLQPWRLKIQTAAGTDGRKELEAYYKALPPLSRGHAVPTGYPTQNAGLLGTLTNTIPRIVPVTFGRTLQYFPVNATGKGGMLPPVTLAPAAFIADKDTAPFIVVLKPNPEGPYGGNAFTLKGWYNKRLLIYWTGTPHLLFDYLFRAGKINADPMSGFWSQYNKAWYAEPYWTSLLHDAVAVTAAICCAYALGGVTGSSTTAAGSGTGTGAGTGTGTGAGAGGDGTTTITYTQPSITAQPVTIGNIQPISGPYFSPLAESSIGTGIAAAGVGATSDGLTGMVTHTAEDALMKAGITVAAAELTSHAVKSLSAVNTPPTVNTNLPPDLQAQQAAEVANLAALKKTALVAGLGLAAWALASFV